MQENWQKIIAAFSTDKSFVLASIIATRGSTYRKTGTMMLISEQGECTGLLSGGCLEADISLHAKNVLASQQKQILTYDLKADAELLWGLGLGCDGAIDILLQPLLPENNHLGFGQLLEALQQGKTGFYCQQVSELGDAQAWFIDSQLDDKTALNSQLTTLAVDLAADELLITPITPVFSLLLCGAGPDAVPVVDMAHQMGWKITLQDHRPTNLNQPAFAQCFDKRKLRAENVQREDFIGFNGMIIMTHNLSSDEILLKHALDANIGYIGLLGPSGRRDKLLNNLALTASDVKGQIFGPIGLDIGGRSEQAIALSICAEIQQYISQQYQQMSFKPWRQ